MNKSLLLELTFEEKTRMFELRPGDDRVIVVGSLLRAHVRVDRASVKPVHFEFERVGDDLLLKPAYGADVRVRGEAVSEPLPLHGESLLEFAGVQLHVRMRGEAGTAIAPPTQTTDPMLTITRPEDEDTVEITEVLPPAAHRKAEPPRPSPRSKPDRESTRTGDSAQYSRAPGALATSATTSVAVPKPPATGGAVSDPPNHRPRTRPRVATIAMACLLLVAAVLMVIGLIRMFIAS
jgi:hypothetical protein